MDSKSYDPKAAVAEFPADGWFKATASNAGGGCVEVNLAREGVIGLRDSKQPEAGAFEFNRTEWAAFLDGVGKGEFNLPA